MSVHDDTQCPISEDNQWDSLPLWIVAQPFAQSAGVSLSDGCEICVRSRLFEIAIAWMQSIDLYDDDAVRVAAEEVSNLLRELVCGLKPVPA